MWGSGKKGGPFGGLLHKDYSIRESTFDPLTYGNYHLKAC